MNLLPADTLKSVITYFIFVFFQISTSVPRMEARVTKTRCVSTTMDRTLVFAKMASREMAQFALVK